MEEFPRKATNCTEMPFSSSLQQHLQSEEVKLRLRKIEQEEYRMRRDESEAIHCPECEEERQRKEQAEDIH